MAGRLASATGAAAIRQRKIGRPAVPVGCDPGAEYPQLDIGATVNAMLLDG
ncbi:hypothetical protein OAF54_02980 [bacterium]|nr:hypothetical protein [bacterium]